MNCTIIIPAHNESCVVAQSLRAILDEASSGDQVLVVCNGCSDDTAAVARQFEPALTVLELEQASKVAALNLGDCQALHFPRIYLDADVALQQGALSKIVDVLAREEQLAVSPRPVMDFTGASWAVRAYYDIWLSLPYASEGMMGAGVYALSKAGRARFGQFPDLISDDGYVRALFQEHERSMVKDAQAIVRAPSSLYWLIKIKTRSRLGVMELRKKYPELNKNEKKDYSQARANVLKKPALWHKVCIYLIVLSFSRLLAARKFANLDKYVWEKDASTRAKS